MTVILGPILSQAADLWGRKWFLVGSTVFAFIGCIISSRATSINMFLAGQGLACVIFGAQPIVYSVASEIVPRRYRPAAQGIMNFCGGTGAVIALIGGFAMIENITGGWRVFYYTFTAIFIISAIAFAVLYNPPPRPLQNTLSTGQKLARLDWIAYFLLASGMLLFVIGLSWADDPYSWSSAHVLAPLLVGIALIGLLAVHQSFFKKDGLMHHDLFSKDRNFALAAVVIFLDGAVFFSCTNYYPLEIALVFLATDVQVGVHFAIAFIAAIVSSMLVAVYSSKTKDIRSPIIVSFVFFACFFGKNPCTAASEPRLIPSHSWHDHSHCEQHQDCVWSSRPPWLRLRYELDLSCHHRSAQHSASPDCCDERLDHFDSLSWCIGRIGHL